MAARLPLHREPGVLARIAEGIAPGCAGGSSFSLPAGYVGRNGDAHVADGFGFEPGTSLAREQAEAEATRAGFDAADRAHVLTDHVRALYAELQSLAAR